MVERLKKYFEGEAYIEELQDSDLVVCGSLCEIDGERFGIGFEVGDKVRNVYLALLPVYGNWAMINMEFDVSQDCGFVGSEFVIGKFLSSGDVTLINEDEVSISFDGLRDLEVVSTFFQEGELLDKNEDYLLDISRYVKSLIEVVYAKTFRRNNANASSALGLMKDFVRMDDLKSLLKPSRRVSGVSYDWGHALSNYRSYDSSKIAIALGEAFKSKEVTEGFMLDYFLKGGIGSSKIRAYRENLLNQMSDDCLRRMFGFVNKDAQYDGGSLKVWNKLGYKYLSFEDNSKNFISVEDMEGCDVRQVDIYRTFLERLV